MGFLCNKFKSESLIKCMKKSEYDLRDFEKRETYRLLFNNVSAPRISFRMPIYLACL